MQDVRGFRPEGFPNREVLRRRAANGKFFDPGSSNGGPGLFLLENRRLGLAQTYPRLMAIVALATCLTLPYVWFVLPAFLPKGPVYAVTAELFAFIVEALWYRLALSGKGTAINIKQAAILSALANAFSFLLGVFIMPR